MRSIVPIINWLLTITLIAIATMLMGQNAMADDMEEDLKLRKSLESRIEAISNNGKLYKQMVKEGRERTILCNSCHGKDGIAVQPLAPNLAGQNPVYIVDQFQRFGDGRRNDYLMSNLAKTFSFEDKIKIALYYGDMQMKPSGGGNSSLLAEGKKIFKDACVKCHGENGRGQEGYARLAGQRHDYVVKMLKEFRDRTGKRTNVWMSGVAIRLSDSDMDAVATYLANLK
ncbi:MAG: c-type cytochrome [Candidatus Thiodiazotropha sp. (ex Lucina aurantia)]|uniref:C-type cytochrome n=1 Tax=Candidatus Thiodiazotropha taylori TaxID=2792791 RepID=A0A9E4TRK3_9GAMM|nr:c-type cytochrome [Candidatus Thiodiazotropha sp. (ex Lucina pensylvanica)]MBT3022943.1 c-type cytochrome [Candidatus Thiodiazotropha taylori]MBT3038753.1 c-type cytochrome [Candidatus Thiodiazotropha sp. (ex Codakia orbicularis)]MBV2102727.1 c-type cytochrome [Candidatus Thiodiazotropha sp. (ex Lucina aurantia)]MCW4235457.1 c-type cytochrome [Candidatus Thiodiazotropha endolucinida]